VRRNIPMSISVCSYISSVTINTLHTGSLPPRVPDVLMSMHGTIWNDGFPLS